jgi:hypothetical protein
VVQRVEGSNREEAGSRDALGYRLVQGQRLGRNGNREFGIRRRLV